MERFTVDLCDDCITMAANGWDERLIGRPLPNPVPLCLIPDDALVGSGDEPFFSKSPCEGCGERLHGNRTTVPVVIPTGRKAQR